jgi:hypothetical protein
MMQAARAACAAQLRQIETATRYSRRCGEPGRAAAVNLDA